MSDADRERLERARNPQPEQSYDPWGRLNMPDNITVDIVHDPKHIPGVTGTYGPSDKTGNTGNMDDGGGFTWGRVQMTIGNVALVVLGIVLIIIALLSTDIGKDTIINA